MVCAASFVYARIGVSRFHSAVAWKYTERFITGGRTHVGTDTNGHIVSIKQHIQGKIEV